jgi:hypothetical protein
MDLPESFHDLLTATWEEAQSSLSLTQVLWCRAYLEIADRTNVFPTASVVAQRLGVSFSASCRMRRRIIPRLLPYYRRYLQEKRLDELFLTHGVRKHKEISRWPEYLERRRGCDHLMHWKVESTWNDRLGLMLYSGRSGRQVRTRSGLEHLPVRTTSVHKASPLSQWWATAGKERAARTGQSFSQAHREVFEEYWSKWPHHVDESRRYCRVCRSLLPLGAEIDGAKVTVRREICSRFCKAIWKRRRNFVP